MSASVSPSIRWLTALAVALVAVPFIGSRLFRHKVKREVDSLLAKQSAESLAVIREADLARLPSVVQRWLTKANVVGKPAINWVYLKQKGHFMTKPGGNWLPLEAEQYFTVNPPGFIWETQIKMAPLVYVAGRDKYEDGHGNMLIKPLSVFTLNDARGPKIDQGTLLRYLGEIIWFPSAALSHYITWQEIDDHSALATMRYANVVASATFHFTDQNDVASITAQRFMGENGQLEPWTATVLGYSIVNGIRLPARFAGSWQLNGGPYTYIKAEVTHIAYH